MSHSGHAQSGYTYDDHGYDDDLEIPRPSASFRVPRRRAGMDATTRNMALVAAGIAGVIVLAVAGQALLRPHGLPVVTAQSGPWREKPANPGGMQVTGAGNAIFNGTRPGGEDKAMPGPETPDLAALARDEHKSPPAAQAPAAQTPAAQAPAAAPVPAATPAQAATSLPATAPQPARPEAPKTAMAAAPQAPAVAPKAAAVAPRTDQAVPAPAAAAQAAAAQAIPAQPAAAPAAAGHAEVQLGALPTEAAAHAEWLRLSHLMPGLLGRHTPLVSRAEVNGHTWWRLRTAGFPTATEAKDFCAQVRAKGGACAVERS
jgi:hypothetical protein